MSAFFATCAKGLEYLLRDELVALGASNVREALAGVHFEGDLEAAYRACLGSRLASRILLPLASFAAADDDALFAGVSAIDWREHMAVSSTLAVDAVCVNSHLQHSRFVALRVKDAIVDQFREREGERPSIDPAQPDLRLNLHLKRDRATLSVDLAGTPLHRRGWRMLTGQAPLKEDLAAAILMRAGWPARYAQGGSLVDPMCGSATLLIEAALMSAAVAPGLQRDYFGLLGWRGHDAALWQRLRDEARVRADAGLRDLRPVFFGSDVDGEALAAAKRNAQAAGVAGCLHLTRQDVAHVDAPAGDAHGLVVCNPPYGERLGDRAALPTLYRSLGQTLATRFAHWHAAVITSDAELGHALGLHASKHYKLFNGALECVLLLFDLSPQAPRVLKPLSAGGEMLKNRLQKNLRHIRRRAQREGIDCYRVYDRNLPEYAAAVDVYQGHLAAATGNDKQVWLHVQEYQAPADVPEHIARDRVREMMRVLGELFDIPREHLALKTRQRGKGGSRYGRFADRSEWLHVDEDGLGFIVN
ncbi:MAG: bifunctional 23S rRNA (guanine(2069)-N(7))-methyltransferase RlmK/23S rRNA (guanine(2445)-N(2))-methyltransferase RlmL, partial [Xanthomonadales bacterium]|nr:bifunctional 23S rRNA (guanine(2069)-N(7))-methyltransferase RlmK/23S rRNA (guanine(2445)-N(2))-methyltransferase RlmL [Xanthomonadales bacterium]